MNRVILVGNLTRDPEMRYTPSGTSVANFGIAVNRRRVNQQGERVDEVDYFNVVVWGKLAELCTTYITKGTPVALEGRLSSRSWETEDGQKRTAVEVVAENVQFLGRRMPEPGEEVVAARPAGGPAEPEKKPTKAKKTKEAPSEDEPPF